MPHSILFFVVECELIIGGGIRDEPIQAALSTLRLPGIRIGEIKVHVQLASGIPVIPRKSHLTAGKFVVTRAVAPLSSRWRSGSTWCGSPEQS